MAVIALECPNCGANIRVYPGWQDHVCEYCGTQIMNPVTANQAPNREFEEKLALAQTIERAYYQLGPYSVKYGVKRGFDAVVAYYGDAEMAGGVTRSDYYIPLARFLAYGRLQALRDGTQTLVNRQILINGYLLAMDHAIRYASPEERPALEKEKYDTTQLLNMELQKYPERPAFAAGCFIATAVDGGYNCPEVWTLRRFRDLRLKQSRLGRAFIKLYYAISPALVRRFGHFDIFTKTFRMVLDPFVDRLRRGGFESTPYEDV